MSILDTRMNWTAQPSFPYARVGDSQGVLSIVREHGGKTHPQSSHGDILEVLDSTSRRGCAMQRLDPTLSQLRRFGVFLLSAYRELRSVYPGGFESFLVATCAAMGHRKTGKPVNVSSIAELTGIPRPTVIRKLHLLEELGLARRAGTGKGTMIVMSPESWEHVRPHVQRLLELENQLAIEDGD